jgi:hypothetical protein
VDSSNQSHAIFKGTQEAHHRILKIPDKLHIHHHCAVEDVTWRAQMGDKRKFPGWVYNKIKLISLISGDTLTCKAWELSFKEWKDGGWKTFFSNLLNVITEAGIINTEPGKSITWPARLLGCTMIRNPPRHGSIFC